MKSGHDPLKLIWLNESRAGHVAISQPHTTQRIDPMDITRPSAFTAFQQNFKQAFGSSKLFYKVNYN